MKETPIAAHIGVSPLAPLPPMKGVEFARFGSRLIVVNHRASPIDISGLPARRLVPQLPSAPGWLAAHSAVMVER